MFAMLAMRNDSIADRQGNWGVEKGLVCILFHSLGIVSYYFQRYAVHTPESMCDWIQ